MDKNGAENHEALAREVIGDLLALMHIEGTVDALEEADDQIYMHLSSPDAGRLIGKNAQTLDALQYVLNRVLIARAPDMPKCMLDIERYRERQKDKLREKALKAAARAVETGRPYTFDPMSSFDRRTIHQALADRDDVETVSEPAETGRWKRLIVRPTNPDNFQAPEDEEPEDEDDAQPNFEESKPTEDAETD